MFLPAASLPGPPFPSHRPLTLLYPWVLSVAAREPQAHFLRREGSHTQNSSAAPAPQIPPASPPGPPFGRGWWVLRSKNWGRPGLCPHLLASLQRAPAPAPNQGTSLGSEPSTKPGSWLGFGTPQAGPGSAPCCRLTPARLPETVLLLRVQIPER